MALLLIVANSSGTLSPEVSKRVGTIRNSISTAISSATSAARNNNLSFKMELPKSKMERNKEQLLAAMHKGAISTILNRNKGIAPTSLPTATGGMTCNSDFSSCTGTVNGTAKCAAGGTVQLKNMVVIYAFTSSPSLGWNGSAKGTIILNKCKSSGANYYDYPNYVVSQGTGTITTDSTNKLLFNTYTASTATTSTSGGVTTYTFAKVNQNYTFEELSTSSSTDFQDASGTTVAFTDLKNTLKLTVDAAYTNFIYGSNADSSIVTLKADIVDILDGSLTSTGTVGGQAINASYTYLKSKSYSYSVSCSLTAVASDCSITLK